MNHASFSIENEGGSAEKEMVVTSKEIGMIHAQYDNPEAKFDLRIIDKSTGVEQLVRKDISNPTKRWGERINLPLSDNYYIIKVDNVRGAKKLDIFLE